MRSSDDTNKCELPPQARNDPKAPRDLLDNLEETFRYLYADEMPPKPPVPNAT